MTDTSRVERLTDMAVKVRLNILELVGIGRAGHLGGSNSIADCVTALYFDKMRYDPKNPKWELRDRLILSKGHAALCQYAALAELGVIDKSLFSTIKELGSTLQGHPDMTKCPGIEANTGSLGQGLSISMGMALGLRLDNIDSKVYCVLGDGELDEGQVWEAVMAAANFKLSNLVAIIDNNKVQATDELKNVMDSGDIAAKFAAFNWNVVSADGHDMQDVLCALDKADESKDKPTAIVLSTIKGKGVSFAEGKAAFHNGALTQEQYDIAKADILKGGASND